jgi:homoserine kinase
MPESIKVYAPATVANVTCGFDVLGFAVDNPGDEVELRLSGKAGVTIKAITGDGGRLSLDPMKNTASISIHRYFQHYGIGQGVEMVLHKKMPLGSGLGSSAASTVAGVFAASKLLGRNESALDLLPFAMEGEFIACGSAHADNVAPALFGGFVLVRSYDPLDVVKIPTPENLYATIIHPHIEVETKDARSILPMYIPLKEGIKQWGNVGGLIAGLMMRDFGLISRSLEDVIIEPKRAILLPGFYEAKHEAMQAGSLGGGISGSGPSIFQLSKDNDTARKVGDAMQAVYRDLGIGSEVYVSRVNLDGPVVLG